MKRYRGERTKKKELDTFYTSPGGIELKKWRKSEKENEIEKSGFPL